MTDRPRRSVLYLPANRDGAVARARTLPADVVILDLEDAVQPDAKPAARGAAIAAARAGGWGERELLLRVNALDTEFGAEDFAAAAGAGFAGLVVPKVGSAAAAAEAVERAAGLPVWAMIESPGGVLAAPAIAATAGIAALIAGFADLAKDLGCRPGPQRLPLLHAMGAIVIAARAAGIAVFDGVFVDIRDEAGFAAEAVQARDFGFDGKTLIHPSQVEPCNRAFSPDEAEIADARGLIAAYQAGLAAGTGVTTYKGRMVEILHVAEARRTLVRAGAP